MENILNLLINRIKKSIPLLIIIPLLLAGLGYFFEMKTEPVVSYAAKAKIELGYYEDRMNNAETVKRHITGNTFLKSTFPEYEPEELEALRSGIVINTLSDTTIELIYRSDNEEEVEEGLERLVDAFLAEDNELYEARSSINKNGIKDYTEEEVSNETKVEKLSETIILQKELLTLYPAELTEPVMVSESRSEDFSNKKRAVLGGLIGVTIVFGYIVVPLLFREEDM
ncbi:hypothetical protein FZC74_07330 [Sutcliffiella horikoshii]|uniref:Polysaccharide chain length determinant N-terminal domain-containing protein n=1 Tax=Sutcliffiella horikoshii TaxID=79883 RepID=A0AA95B6Q7_9BACI|nr:hypothetical protein [Sutcliffiella horikoshii]TYS59958.1 hypothetical protein FZC74_07330 [Sutcliffiella horikoshii]